MNEKLDSRLWHRFADEHRASSRAGGRARRRCVDLGPGGGWRVFLGSGGGDGVDTAAKLARRYFDAVGEPEHTHLISRTPRIPSNGRLGHRAPVAFPPGAKASGWPSLEEATQVQHDSLEAMTASFDRIGPSRVAAVVAEPVIGAGGLYPPKHGYLEGGRSCAIAMARCSSPTRRAVRALLPVRLLAGDRAPLQHRRQVLSGSLVEQFLHD